MPDAENLSGYDQNQSLRTKEYWNNLVERVAKRFAQMCVEHE